MFIYSKKEEFKYVLSTFLTIFVVDTKINFWLQYRCSFKIDTYHLCSWYLFATDVYTLLTIDFSDLNHFEINRAYEKNYDRSILYPQAIQSRKLGIAFCKGIVAFSRSYNSFSLPNMLDFMGCA